MVTAPPVVIFTTASVACLMRGRNCMKTDASEDGRPCLGSRACRCRIAAPALAASIACVAIWSGVIGNASDMVGVWIEPVIAQLMMIFAMGRFSPYCACAGFAGRFHPLFIPLDPQVGQEQPSVQAGKAASR